MTLSVSIKTIRLVNLDDSDEMTVAIIEGGDYVEFDISGESFRIPIGDMTELIAGLNQLNEEVQ